MRRIGLAVVLTLGLLAPLAAETQQAGKVRPYRVGVLHPAFGETTPTVKGLKAGLKAAALEEGRDVVFEIRFTRGEIHALPEAASALSVGGVDLIFTVWRSRNAGRHWGDENSTDCLRGSGRPGSGGIVKAVARPGGIVTGVSGSRRNSLRSVSRS